MQKLGEFFFEILFLSEQDSGLVFRDGCVIGLSGPLRSLRIPLAISVETGTLEIAGLDLGLGLKIGDVSGTHFLLAGRLGVVVLLDCQEQGAVSGDQGKPRRVGKIREKKRPFTKRVFSRNI